MNIPKKSSLFAALLLALTGTTFGMDTPQKQSWKNRAKWIVTVGEVALGLKPAIALMHQKSIKPSESSINLPTLEPKEFTDLPKDMQDMIVGALLAGENASSLEEAAQSISALAQVNKELNSLINDPQFCLQVIKRLAKKFNSSDERTARILQIPEARRRLSLQKKLADAFQRIYLSITAKPMNPAHFSFIDDRDKEIENFINIIDNNDIDVNFIYQPHQSPLHEMLPSHPEHNGKVYYEKIYPECVTAIAHLIKKGANTTTLDQNGKTPLQWAKEFAHHFREDEEQKSLWQEVIRLLEKK